ncbi:MAG: TolC family protein, partial [Mariprofundaceae bacterium]|nr:TolC family protein [Mariprofundaceae bacterium]
QPLFDLERWAGYRQGSLSAESGELRLQLERQRLMLETARAFLDTLTAQAALVAARAREAAASKLASRAQASFRVGVAAMPERLDAEARLDLARADSLSAENDLNQTRARLISLIGRPAGVLGPMLISDVPAAPSPARAELWEAEAEAHALAVRLAVVQFGMARQGKRKSVGKALPKIEAFGEVGRDRSSDTALGGATVRDQAVGVQLRMPLYAGGGISAQIRKSEKEALQAEFALKDDIRLARLAARQAYLAQGSAAAQLAAMRKAVVSARQAALATHRGYDVGLRSLTEVLDADERSFAAERNRAAAGAQYAFAILQLQASVGALTDRPLPAGLGEPQ